MHETLEQLESIIRMLIESARAMTIFDLITVIFFAVGWIWILKIGVSIFDEVAIKGSQELQNKNLKERKPKKCKK